MRVPRRCATFAFAALVALCLPVPGTAAAADAMLADPVAALAALQRVEKAMRMELAEWKTADGATKIHLVMLQGRVVRVEWERLETLLGIAAQAEKDPAIVTTVRMAMPDEAALLGALGVDFAKQRGLPSADEIQKRLAKLAQQQAPDVKAVIAAREELLAALGEEIATIAAANGLSPVAVDPALAANAERLFAACKKLGTAETVCRCQSDAAIGVVDARVLGAVASFFEIMADGRDALQQILREADMTEQELTSHFATLGAAAKHCAG